VLTLLYLTVLVYALLYPFQFSLPDSDKPFLSLNKLNTEGVPFLVKNSGKRDLMRNTVLFVPFGVFLFAWLRQRIESSALAIGLSVIVAGLVSVTCEALQYFEPARWSAIFDVGANVIGAALGATICRFWFWAVEIF